MRPGRDPVTDRDQPRGRLAPALRRVRLGFLLVWRTRRPPAEEVEALRERLAERERAMDELRLAAEEYHWAVAGDRLEPASRAVMADER
jgi:hypothetical protein